MFSMSYETVVMIIFMAVEVVKKEVLVHPRKTAPKQSLDGAPSQENEFFGKLFSRSGKTALNAKQIGEQMRSRSFTVRRERTTRSRSRVS